ncbi:MAG: hypothetical protein HOU81_26685 [Hamadaea sp.]|uniref:hypothetical protein n=1 Tax=Hamadaea sp. TaxID=2024425 RepID=UPI0017F859BF|nr:hypothetical protein [Hamadaea sp.]NUR74413.1 hypothetical protein [Hamadaea sp.]NUT22935.1 hypothetical protein [Hamadaea sp.]
MTEIKPREAAATTAVGVLALVPIAMIALLVARGAFYGLVDRGPYDNSWGGPSLAGAWTAHFLISLPFIALGVFALAGLRRLRRSWLRWLAGERRRWWVLPVTLVLYAGAAMLVIAWLHQV